MSKLPIYDNLSKLHDVKSSSQNYEQLRLTISSLPEEHSKVVFLLIYHHSLLNSTNNKGKLPYGGNFIAGTSTPLFNMDYLPLDLKQILNKYVASITRTP